uniref:Uncharacterized protein n=1 Tax=Solanum tuberosum TaxID=4113 RepID=M1AF06_SOLTU
MSKCDCCYKHCKSLLQEVNGVWSINLKRNSNWEVNRAAEFFHLLNTYQQLNNTEDSITWISLATRV